MTERERELIDLSNSGLPEARARALGLLSIYQRLAEAQQYLKDADNEINKLTKARNGIWLPEIHEMELLLKELGETIE